MKTFIRKIHLRAASALVAVAGTLTSLAVDPPHKTANNCGDCHLPHFSYADLTRYQGNANLCMTCHTAGRTAASSAFAAADQALPWPGLPTGTNAAGSSHRWDASAAGHQQFLGGAAIASTGTIIPSGVYTGAFAKTYTIQMTVPGAVGTARFNWSATTPGGGGGTNILTATNSPLDSGVTLKFLNHTNTAASFQPGDRWLLYVRPDLRNPTNATLLLYMTNGVVTCSACHDEHSELLPPFDPAAQTYATNALGSLTSGTNRHFMRITNTLHQLCNDCHAARVVTNAAAGSHPVALKFSADTKHKLPSTLPLEAVTTNIGCLTCHKIHHSPDADGKTLRYANSVAVCNDCHTLSDTTSSHFSTTNGATLWPGGKYGSLMPARTDTADRGTCLNCHPIHGWPTNATTPNIHYEHLLADFEENFCYTCHGTNGPAVKLVYADFQKPYRHPVANNDALRRTGRSVECSDCHNVHKSKTGSHNYTNTATSARNLVTSAPSLIGADGVAFTYSGLTNFQTVTTNLFTYLAKPAGVTYEFQICFKCHSTYFWKTGTPVNGLSPNGSATTPVETDLAQEFSPMNKSGHPVITGLNNYPNSTGNKPLVTSELKAPWNVNLGTQTMLCSDCHDATTTNYVAAAAQGPHGSANQYMLRGPNAANWPTGTSFAASWCANCHNDTSHSMDGHATHHSAGGCYRCHVVIPHGSKMSRLLADRDGSMPARYAYNNDKTTIYVSSYTKATGSYSTGNCRTSCGQHSTGSSTSMENW